MGVPCHLVRTQCYPIYFPLSLSLPPSPPPPPPPPAPRILLAQVSYPHWSAPLVCGSIYIPAASGERSEFLHSLPPSIPHKLAFLEGNCNIVANPSLDHLPSLLPSQSFSSPHWRDLADTLLQ